MNEQIFEFGRAATIWCCGNEYSSQEEWDAAWEQKFAELIIRECVVQCESVADTAMITNIGEMARKTKTTADSCAKMIKQRFGVKE